MNSPHDKFAKQLFTEALSFVGNPEASREVYGETKQADISFFPNLQLLEAQGSILGLLGYFASKSAIFEPFRNAPQPKEVRSCVSKLVDVQAELERRAARENTSIAEEDICRLWIITPTASSAFLQGFKAEPENNSPQGVYYCGASFKTAIVVVHDLEVTEETLWLRLLGRGKVQKRAIEEVHALPSDHPLKDIVLELIYSLLTDLGEESQLNQEDRELLMELSPLYTQRLSQYKQEGIQEGIEQGIQQGIQQTQVMFVENLLRVRYGTLDESLKSVIADLIALPTAEMLSLVLQLSREELLARLKARKS